MPELPDVTLYVERLNALLADQRLESARLASPFLLRSVDPPLAAVEGKRFRSAQRLGKRIVLGFEDELFLVLHLMIAGRLRWRPPGVKLARRNDLLALDFADGSLLFTEAGTKKRAALHVVRGASALDEHDRGGLEVLDASFEAFAERLRSASHTLKRALTDPRIFSGIGNAYSDEILHRARLSPLIRTGQLDDAQAQTLYAAIRSTLKHWLDALRTEVGEGFPEKVTAFHAGMAVHGRYGKPCPDCSAPVQRIVYASREINYCAGCQTAGRLLADRALSRLLKDDWPKRLEELAD